MRGASIVVVTSVLFGGAVFAASCGGDDSSSNTNTTGSTSSGSAGSSSTGAGGGSSTSTTGSGGGSFDAGAGCPSMRPGAGDTCTLDHGCTYPGFSCDCVGGMWSCTATPGGDASGCPMDTPDPGESCTQQGLVCTYSDNSTCTCDTTDGWGCVQSQRGR